MRYEKYKQTGTKWITSIPVSWDMQKIGALFVQRKEKVSDKDFAPISVTKNGILPQLATAAKTDDGDNRKKVCVGDFVINSRSDRKGSCGVSDLEGSVSLINIVLQPREQLSGKYAHYLLRNHLFSEEYYRNGRGIVADLWTTRYSEMKTILLPVPPRAEQDQIVRYLDWQVSKINWLIATKRKEIALLHEQHKRRISEAVLHGNDDGCCQKDSGVEWIGMIPEHWSVIRCKYVFTERDERSIAGEEEHLSMSQKYGLVPDSKLDERRMLSESYVGGKVCYKNDLVLNRLKAHLGVFALSPQKGVISPDYTVLIPNAERILPTYGEAVLKNDLCRRELRIRVRGIIEGFWRLYTDDFNTIVIPLPPLKEQEQIMKHLSALNNKFTALKQRLEQEINILHELRTRLISDVVTGQIDVRGIKVPDVEYTYTETREEELEETEEN